MRRKHSKSIPECQQICIHQEFVKVKFYSDTGQVEAQNETDCPFAARLIKFKDGFNIFDRVFTWMFLYGHFTFNLRE